MKEQKWRELVAAFENHLRAERGLADLTIRNYGTDIESLYDYMKQENITELASLDKLILRGYLAWLVELGYVRRSISRKKSALRSFLRWLVRQKIIEKDLLPRRSVMKMESRLPRFLSQKDATRLMKAPDISTILGTRDRAILEIIYGAGLRVSETKDLEVGNVSLVTGEVRVRGKGYRERISFIGEPAIDALHSYLSEVRPGLVNHSSGNALFLNRYGSRLSQRSIQEKVRRYAGSVRAGSGVHTHTLRHTFATHMLEGGADLRVVQELMGHASPATTQIYTHVTQTQARKVYLSAHPRATSSRHRDVKK